MRSRGTWTKANPSPTAYRKGQSGNVTGRPKALADLEEMARAHTPAAIQALADALASPRERVAAATVLLDRGWGKPRQQIEVSADDGVIALHLTAARALLSAFDAEGSRPPTIEAQPESEPAFNLLDAPKPVE